MCVLFQKQFFKTDKDTIFSVFINENQYKDVDKLAVQLYCLVLINL